MTGAPLAGARIAEAADQPPEGIEYEWTTVDSVFIKRMWIKRAGLMIPQHAHVYEHGSFVASGAIRVWRDGVLDRDYSAFSMLTIKAGVKHLFMALVPDTNVLCIHNTMRKEIVEILESHEPLKGLR